MPRQRWLVALMVMMNAAPGHAGGDVEAGERKSAKCAACHGVDGVSDNPVWPNLAAYFASRPTK